MFPFKTILKQHILEKHCSPHIKKKRDALGLMGEKGTENSHQMISSIERGRAQGIRNVIAKLHHILTAQFTPGGAFSPKLNCDKYTSPKLNYDNIKDDCVVYGASSMCHSFLYVVLFYYCERVK